MSENFTKLKNVLSSLKFDVSELEINITDSEGHVTTVNYHSFDPKNTDTEFLVNLFDNISEEWDESVINDTYDDEDDDFEDDDDFDDFDDSDEDDD